MLVIYIDVCIFMLLVSLETVQQLLIVFLKIKKIYREFLLVFAVLERDAVNSQLWTFVV